MLDSQKKTVWGLRTNFRKKSILLSHRTRWGVKKRKILKKSLHTEYYVSLTSYPAQIKFLDLTIQSLLLQNTEYRVPIVISIFEEDIHNYFSLIKEYEPFDVIFLQTPMDYKSYKKYWPCQNPSYSERIMISADDDISYPSGWIERIISLHIENPQLVHGLRGNLVPIEPQLILDYANWQPINQNTCGHHVFLTTGAGVIFPRNSLKHLFNYQDLFLKIAPTSDDLFIWKYLSSSGKSLNCFPGKEVKTWPDSQVNALWVKNVNQGGNNQAIALIQKYFKI